MKQPECGMIAVELNTAGPASSGTQSVATIKELVKMTLISNQFQQLKWLPALLMLTFVGLAECGDHQAEDVLDKSEKLSKNEKPVVAVKPLEVENPKKRELTSPDYWLEPSEYEFFRPGRLKSEILTDVNWKGAWYQTTKHQGKSIAAINFGFFERPPSGKGTMAWAIFVDDKFEKFVRFPKPVYDRKVGNFQRLINAYNSDSVSVPDLRKERNELSARLKKKPRKTDWGLTFVWLLFSKGIIEREAAEEKKREALYPEYLKRNAILRDQFNAARLKIGMTEKDVDSIFKAKPLHTGKVEAGPFKIYGSNERLVLGPNNYLHYVNSLIVYREGKVIGIHAIPGCSLMRTMKMFKELSQDNFDE